MAITTGPQSRFRNTESVLYNGNETFGTWSQADLFIRPKSPGDYFLYTVTNSYEGRPDLIAFEVYNSSELDWIIIAYNKPRQVLNWPIAGDVIKVPRASVVSLEILS